MPPIDPEKRTAALDDVQELPRRRRWLTWLAAFTAVLFVLSAGRSATCVLPADSYSWRGGPATEQSEGPPAHAVDAITPQAWTGSQEPLAAGDKLSSVSKRQTSATTTASALPTVLECFQVAQPVLTPNGTTYQSTTSDGATITTSSGGSSSASAAEPCTVLLMRHDFAFSYGIPFVGNYTPPNCQFNRVVMNFTVVSSGRQFDRLALMYLGDTEVWRTSTAEPVVPPGIRWVYEKDMTEYLYFWKSPQKLIFDLGNLVNDKYTGIFNTTLTATFFQSDVGAANPPSDLIIPISKRQGAAGAVSLFQVPEDNATTTVAAFPRNARRAVFSVSACGQADEEFWWSNVLQSDVLTFNKTAGALPGYSPFREVQVLIDGTVAGVQWPFPVIFTGGVVPGLHRPIVGIDAFDLREHEIDITPFLPLLCDGMPHTFSIRVAGLNDTGASGADAAHLTESVGSSWYVTGKVFVWLDDEGSVTTGDPPTIAGNGAPAITVTRRLTQSRNGTNETLAFDTTVQRTLLTSARVVTQRSTTLATWIQTLSYTNRAYASAFGFDQVNNFLTSGTEASSSSYNTQYQYPLFANSSYSVAPAGNITIRARVTQGLELAVGGASVFPTGLEAFSIPGRNLGSGGSRLATSKDGNATFYQTGDGRNSSGFGASAQVFRFGAASAAGVLGQDPDVELYYRNVSAVNGSVVYDSERVAGTGGGGAAGGSRTGQAATAGGGPAAGFAPMAVTGGDGKTGPRVFMGRMDPAETQERTPAAVRRRWVLRAGRERGYEQ